MAQVSRTTNELIVNSLYLLGELGVGEQPDAFMLSTGLELINELLDKFAADSIYVPFLTTINFTMVPGKDTYSISDMAPADITADRIIDLSFATYTINGVSNTNLVYPIRIINKATYFGVVRQTGLLARPGFALLNKEPLDSQVIFYPAPDQPYPASIKVKCMLDMMVQQEDIGIEIPPYYYGFMKYALARKFLSYYPSGNWPQQNEDEYQDYYNNMKNSNETDLTIRPSVTLTAPEPFYWPNILSY